MGNLADILDERDPAVGRDSNGRFVPGHSRGRPPGRGPAQTLAVKIREAMATALEGAGNTLKEKGHAGEGGADTYLRWLAIEEPRTFGGLLAKLLPTKLAGSDDPDDAPLLVERVERILVRPDAKPSPP